MKSALLVCCLLVSSSLNPLPSSPLPTASIPVYGQVEFKGDTISDKLSDSEKKEMDRIVLTKADDYEEVILSFTSVNTEEKQWMITSMKKQLNK